MGKEATAPTIQLDATPSGPSTPPPPSSHSAATLLIYPGLGQALNMLDCILGGLVLQFKNIFFVLSILQMKTKKLYF